MTGQPLPEPVRGAAHNALLDALREHGDWLKLSSRVAIADEVAAALFPVIAAEIDNAVNWHTSCVNCARLLDSCHTETARAEQAEQRLAQVRELAGELGAEPAMRWGPSFAKRLLEVLDRDLSNEQVEH